MAKNVAKSFIPAFLVLTAPLTEPARAGAVEQSLRPQARPAMMRPALPALPAQPAAAQPQMPGTFSHSANAARLAATLDGLNAPVHAPVAAPTAPAAAPPVSPTPPAQIPDLVTVSAEASASPSTSLRPRLRPGTVQAAATPTPAVAPAVAPAPHGEANPGFDRWVQGFRPRAQAKGIRADVLDRAFARAEFLPSVIELDQSQSEFTKSIGDYLSTAVSDDRVSNGRSAMQTHGATLREIETRYGVSRNVVAAVWGMETNFGGYRGRNGIVSALATLAYEGRRASFFEEQLIAALRILQSGDTTPDAMKGSWAGAMGHTQFMPTSYLEYAVDFTGDGRRDIWGEDPADALASTANYLKSHGWITGQPWGVEVVLPQGFDYAQTDGRQKMPSEWARLGVRDIDGNAVADYGSARVLVPAGARGVAFLVFKNFDVIKRYNPSDAYALGVGHLGDRIGGGGPFHTAWPQGERGLKKEERMEMQTLLGRKGHGAGTPDGIIGPNTQTAIRSYQTSVGLTPDGYASVALLERLRR